MAIESPGAEPILLDIGTGLRYFGLTQPLDGSFRGTALVSHLHWDHIQGLPFFGPGLCAGAQLDVYAPAQPDCSVSEAFARFMCDPFFPITLEQMPGSVRLHDTLDDNFKIGDVAVTVRVIPHIGTTLGYRIERDGRSVAYLPDHQQPLDRSMQIDDNVLELVDGCDLLIHDAQYTTDEWELKAHWGHCTADFAMLVAREAGARRLALFHHDPSHHDDMLDDIGDIASRLGDQFGIEVVMAAEGMTVNLADLD